MAPAPMLRTLFILSLLISASSAHAGWELVTKNPRGDLYYLDTRIVQKGGTSLVWGLVDLVSPIEKSASVKRLYEVDCVKGKFRVAQKIVYESKGGQGNVISTDKKPGPWAYPDPASVNEELVLKICFEKKEGQAEEKKQKEKHEKHDAPAH